MCFNTSNDEKKDVVYNNENDNTTNRNIENFSKIDKQVINFNDKVMPEDGSEADKSLLGERDFLMFFSKFIDLITSFELNSFFLKLALIAF